MHELVVLLLILTAGLLLFSSVAYLLNHRPRRGSNGGTAGDEASAELSAGEKLKIRLAFGYSALLLLAHRAAMTYMLLSTDFNARDAQVFFGMSWWFLDPLAGFPIIFGTLPFAKDMPLPRFINSYYVPLSLILYGAVIYGLWRLSRRAFFSPGAQVSGTEEKTRR
ncbi:MAG: hypothetical protein A2X35_01570 [Elusimicrobia bacterium GWA2_61_42]|nr:MAG: hypothetical protein A2X35_01570 [Elusimicrobia bacterium GWA2_61_42]OGR76836.1 MAG: hypothetical protein A2X38_11745 [Elusimicrobia bacterium GWC2_61_25]